MIKLSISNNSSGKLSRPNSFLSKRKSASIDLKKIQNNSLEKKMEEVKFFLHRHHHLNFSQFLFFDCGSSD